MKKIILLATLLTLGLVVVTPPPAAQAAEVTKLTHLSVATAAAETFQFSFRGKFAEAQFYNVSGCIETDVYVIVVDGRVKLSGSPTQLSSFAYGFIVQYDFCNGVYLFLGDGYAALTPSFVIDNRLNTATLNMTINIFDYVSGANFPVNYNVNWTGTGGLVTVKERRQIKAPGFLLNESLNGTLRNANASGSILLGGTNLTPDPTFYADMGSEKDAQVVVYH
jgi:hypothetical protein